MRRIRSLYTELEKQWRYIWGAHSKRRIKKVIILNDFKRKIMVSEMIKLYIHEVIEDVIFHDEVSCSKRIYKVLYLELNKQKGKVTLSTFNPTHFPFCLNSRLIKDKFITKIWTLILLLFVSIFSIQKTTGVNTFFKDRRV